MKYIIKEAVPVLEKVENQRGVFEYKVTHWCVKYKQWDGLCMCSMEDRAKTVASDKLVLSREELTELIK